MAVRVYNAAETKQDLYDRITVQGEFELLFGNSSFGDIFPEWWQYDINSSATDDFVNGVIKPTLQTGNGRWLRKFRFLSSDWTQATSSALDYIKNKPSLAAVATSGSYNDLSDTPSIPATTRTTSPLSLSLVGTGATGTQISSTKDSTVRLTCSTSTTSTIGGPATSVILLKICSTNNATEGSWTTVATLESDQTITLAVVLQSLQVVKGQLCTDVPAGWFLKLVNSGTGTHTEAFVSGQQTIYG